MHPLLFLAAIAGPAPSPAPASDGDETIVVTASREPLAEADAPASTTTIGEDALDLLSLPAVSDVLRLTPGLSVAASGPRGSQTQVRVRGAEANHTLLFVDGIRFNDPAAGNEARFELLTGDSLSRIEVVRGPQSALWGSEALGGVVSVETADARRGTGFGALGEYGGLDSYRASGRTAVRNGPLAIAASAGLQGSDGIDSFADGAVERDGFRNRSASLKAILSPAEGSELGLVGHWMEGLSEYDGFDPATFRRSDTLDDTKNRIGAVRGWGRLERGGWTASADLSFLASANRNRLAGAPLNRTSGERLTAGVQLSRRLGGHRLTTAVEHEAEDFRARDQSFFGATDQDRSRRLTALVGEWRAEWGNLLATDIALRHDSFSAFEDSTTLRASALLRPGGGIRIHGAYGEGIAQPTFYDLFGFFPGNFQGNPALKPERSAGFEAGIGWAGSGVSLAATAFTNRLKDEIVDVFDPATFLSSAANAAGTSRRRGLELEAEYRRSAALHFALNYTLLDSSERQAAGGAAVREVRRPRHSANLLASGRTGALTWGAALAYVGARSDTDFDSFPARRVRLGDYLLANLRIGWEIDRRFEAFARVENGFGDRYEDAFGYRTAGRTAYAGIRLRFGD